ncbi:MAG: extracellular solute-binding protein, partial [Actinobacteria bacterium]|nr:extracellular solute-binding protein [Actinomycetota bacterium]
TVRTAIAPWAQANGVTATVVVKDFGTVRDELITAGPKGLGPDVVIAPHDWLGGLAASGVVDRVSNLSVENYASSTIDAITYKGLKWGVPVDVENVALVVNTELAKAPKTLDELETNCAAAKAAVKGFKVCLELPKGATYHSYPLFTALGGYIFKWNGKSYNLKDILGGKQFQANASKLDEYYKSGVLSKDAAWGFAEFYGGRAPYVIMGPWDIADLKKQTKVKYSIVPFPSGKYASAPFLGVNAFYLSKYAKNKVTARSFLNGYASGKDFGLAWFKSSGKQPANLEAAADPAVKANAELAGFASFSAAAQPMPNVPQMGSVWGAWENALNAVADGKSTAGAAFTTAAATIKKTIGS